MCADAYSLLFYKALYEGPCSVKTRERYRNLALSYARMLIGESL